MTQSTQKVMKRRGEIGNSFWMGKPSEESKLQDVPIRETRLIDLLSEDDVKTSTAPNMITTSYQPKPSNPLTVAEFDKISSQGVCFEASELLSKQEWIDTFNETMPGVDLESIANFSIELASEFALTWEVQKFTLNLEVLRSENGKVFTTQFDSDRRDNPLLITRDFVITNGFPHYIYHNLAVIPTDLQGTSIAKRLLAVYYPSYLRWKAQEIRVLANLEIGGYAWAQYGFRAAFRQEIEALVSNSVPNKLTPSFNQTWPVSVLDASGIEDAKGIVEDWFTDYPDELIPMNLLSEQPYGRALLCGSSWHGSLPLIEPEDRKPFENYIRSYLL